MRSPARYGATILLLAMIQPGAAAVAQSGPDSADRLRVTWRWPDRGTITGDLSEATTDSLVLIVGSETRSIATDRILKLEAGTHVGTRKSYGMAYGALMGAIVGALGPLAVCGTHCDESGDNPVGAYMMASIPIGILAGGLIGSSIGSGVPAYEWREVSLTADGMLRDTDPVEAKPSTPERRVSQQRFRISPWVGGMPASATKSPIALGLELQARLWRHAAIELTGAASTEYTTSSSFSHLDVTDSQTVKTIGYHIVVIPIPDGRLRPLLAFGQTFVMLSSDTITVFGDSPPIRYSYSDQGIWPIDLQAGFEYALTPGFSLDARAWAVNFGESISDFGLGARIGVNIGLHRNRS